MEPITYGNSKGYLVQRKEIDKKLKELLKLKDETRIIHIHSHNEKYVTITYDTKPLIKKEDILFKLCTFGDEQHNHAWMKKTKFCKLIGIGTDFSHIKSLLRISKGKFLKAWSTDIYDEDCYCFFEIDESEYAYINEKKK